MIPNRYSMCHFCKISLLSRKEECFLRERPLWEKVTDRPGTSEALKFLTSSIADKQTRCVEGSPAVHQNVPFVSDILGREIFERLQAQ
jgi:hypothetical protein